MIDPESIVLSAGRGILAGLAGTAVMTAFQEYVEMPLIRRTESYAPADVAGRILRLHPTTRQGRRRLNYAAHYVIGGAWGAAYALAAALGLRGQAAANAVFCTVYGGGLLAGVATKVSRPQDWTAEDWVVDLVDIYVQVQATGFVFDRLPGSSGRR